VGDPTDKSSPARTKFVPRLSDGGVNYHRSISGNFEILGAYGFLTFEFLWSRKNDGTTLSVIPAEAGIQEIQIVIDSCLRRSDSLCTFYKTINFGYFSLFRIGR
jgi:hypothetical protein